jgi:hypothetical protein
MSSESLNLSNSNHAATVQIINAITVDEMAIEIKLPLASLLGHPPSSPSGLISLAFLLLPNAPLPAPCSAEGREGGTPEKIQTFGETLGAEVQNV